MKRNITHSAIAALLITGVSTSASAADASATLPNARAGECYAKVVIPAQYKNETSELVVKQAAEKIEVIPAKYEWGTQRVLVKEASKKITPVPATYGTETQRVEVAPAVRKYTVAAKSGSAPASPSNIAAAQAAGINLAAAKPGQCFHEHFKPAQYKSEPVEVIVSQASATVEIVPAKYEWAEERLLVKDASKKVVAVPATYKTETEKVMVTPEKTEWKRGRGLVEKIDTTGEIMCLVTVPAVFKTITKRVIDTPASTKVVEIPAEYATQKVRKLVTPAQERRVAIPEKKSTVTKTVKVSDETFVWHPIEDDTMSGSSRTGNQVCVTEAPAKFKTVTRKVVATPVTTKVVEIPAEYKDVKVRKLVTPAQEKRIAIPEQKQTVTKTVKVSDERLEWRQVLCETNMSVDVVKSIQSALNKAGFDAGPPDGRIGTGTLRAVDAYQRKNGLSTGGLTFDTLKSLGINL